MFTHPRLRISRINSHHSTVFARMPYPQNVDCHILDFIAHLIAANQNPANLTWLKFIYPTHGNEIKLLGNRS